MQRRVRLFVFAGVGLIVLLYIVLHLINISALPVFADESIYIRWAQLILDDAQRYWLFALNDGKTPLFVWSIVPALAVLRDQLEAARLVSIGIGLLQVFAMGWLASLTVKRKSAILWSMLLTTVLPFWFFYHRMALMDGLLTLWFTLALGMILWFTKQSVKLAATKRLLFIGGLGFVTFLAIWTKLPAILFIFPLGVFGLYEGSLKKKLLITRLVQPAMGIGLGLVLFALMSVLPAFPQLFSRGGDFLYSLPEFLGGAWEVVFHNTGLSLQSFSYYLTPLILLSPLVGLAFKDHRRHQAVLLLTIALFVLPMWLFAQVLHPRYLLPAATLFTLSSALVFDSTVVRLARTTKKNLLVVSVALALYCANILSYAGQWDFLALSNPDALPLVAADRQQYLEEWSSGHGIIQVVKMLESAAQTQRVAVATEGYFGTLPDGILLYLHNQDVDNISVDGIGQPVYEIPDWFWQKSADADQRWLVVNSYRMHMNLPAEDLIAQFCRPNDAPCLQVWDITQYSSHTLEQF